VVAFADLVAGAPCVVVVAGAVVVAVGVVVLADVVVVVEAVVAGAGGLGGTIPPLNVTVLK
jgi:hypothetical protein